MRRCDVDDMAQIDVSGRNLSAAPLTDTAPQERIVVMRLQKFLARAGVASRRGSEDLMTAGRVRVNGEVVTQLGSKVDPLIDCVTVDGCEVTLHMGHTYLIFHKPCGYLTTMHDPQGRPTIKPFLPCDIHPGLFPVGRLDKETSGLLVCMTDGELAADVLHPKGHVDKVYHAWVEGLVRDHELDVLRDGITLDDGPCAPAKVEILDADTKSLQTLLSITIHEGRKRQVRRMCSAIHHGVQRLERVSFGPLELGTLPEGNIRYLTQGEVDALQAAVRARLHQRRSFPSAL